MGFDYTGYGFLGEDMTTGLYMRIGMQVPYSTLFSLFENTDNNSSDSDVSVSIVSDASSSEVGSSVDMSVGSNSTSTVALSSDSSVLASGNTTTQTAVDKESVTTKYKKEFIFSFTIGPAFRHFISDKVIWYMGMGVTGIIKSNTSNVTGGGGILTSLEAKLGTDLDMGFRVDLASKTSLRAGVHITTGLITYTNSSVSGGGATTSSMTQSLTADIFTKIGEKTSTDAAGYIGVAHVFKSNDVVKYRYSNKTNKLGGGTLTKL